MIVRIVESVVELSGINLSPDVKSASCKLKYLKNFYGFKLSVSPNILESLGKSEKNTFYIDTTNMLQ